MEFVARRPSTARTLAIALCSLVLAAGGAMAAPSTAYLYDWNLLPMGQALWLKELETYQEFPPMQDPASYNLSQVMNELKKPKSVPGQ